MSAESIWNDPPWRNLQTATVATLAGCERCTRTVGEKDLTRTACGMWVCPECEDIHTAHDTSWDSCSAAECAS